MKKACSDVKMTGKTCADFCFCLPLNLVKLISFLSSFPGIQQILFVSVICPASWLQCSFWSYYFVKDVYESWDDDKFFISNVDMSWTCY